MNPYDILGVEKSSTPDEIKKAYRKLAHQYHPDKNPGNKAAEDKFKEANNAYEILSDPQKKSNYDRFGAAGAQAGFGGGNYSGSSQGGFPGGGNFNFGTEGFGGLDDVFEAFFGSGGGSPFGNGQRQGGVSSRKKGIDLEVEMSVNLEEAAKGVTKTFKHKHNSSCIHCEGKGYEKGSKVTTCPTCKGTGQVYQRMQTIFGTVQQATSCPTCDGLGKIYEKTCKFCTGKGFNQEVENLTVQIPVGIETGQKIRVSGKGEAGYRGSEPGDLYIYINVEIHKNFRREGMDIQSNVEINYLDLILGTTLDVETVWGPVEITVPPLTNPEGKLRLRNQGMPKLNNQNVKGDQYLSIKVKMPASLTDKQKEALTKLRAETKVK